MDARTAILRAVKWVSKDKEPTRGMQGILLVPAFYEEGVPRQLVPHPDKELAKTGVTVELPHFPPVVMATDGVTGIVIVLDPFARLPHVCVDGKAVEKALKGTNKATEFWWQPRDKGHVLLETETGTKFLLPCFDPRAHPGYPVLPKVLRGVPDFAAVRALEHIPMKDDTRPELACLRFGPDAVEATDETRNARVSLGCGPAGGILVPKRILQNWPKKKPEPLDVGVAFENELAYVHVDGELRWAETLPTDGFPDLAPILPVSHVGTRVRVRTMALKQAVKHATSYSPKDWVELRFHNDVLAVTGLMEDGGVGFAHEVDAPGAGSMVKVTVRGRLLWQSLHARTDDETTLCYSTAEQAVRIESTGFVEAINPLIAAG